MTSVWGLLALRPIIENLGPLASLDATLAGRVAAAPFVFDAATGRDVAMMGGEILRVRQSWAQAHNLLQFTVRQSWAALEAAAPVAAMEALTAIVHRSAGDLGAVIGLSWDGVGGAVALAGDPFGISARDDLAEMIDTTVAGVNQARRHAQRAA